MVHDARPVDLLQALVERRFFLGLPNAAKANLLQQLDRLFHLGVLSVLPFCPAEARQDYGMLGQLLSRVCAHLATNRVRFRHTI
jgi:hypothetical protein